MFSEKRKKIRRGEVLCFSPVDSQEIRIFLLIEMVLPLKNFRTWFSSAIRGLLVLTKNIHFFTICNKLVVFVWPPANDLLNAATVHRNDRCFQCHSEWRSSFLRLVRLHLPLNQAITLASLLFHDERHYCVLHSCLLNQANQYEDMIGMLHIWFPIGPSFDFYLAGYRTQLCIGIGISSSNGYPMGFLSSFLIIFYSSWPVDLFL